MKEHKRTIGEIKEGLEGMAREYKNVSGDYRRAQINASARSYLNCHVKDEILINYLFKLYERWKLK